MKLYLLLSATLGTVVSCLAFPANAAARLEARIVSDAAAEPLAARVAITNTHGKFVEIEGVHPHVQYLGKRWCYVDGGFAFSVPPGGAGLEIRRGLETRPLFAAIPDDPNRGTLQRTFRLRHWIDLRQKGYFSGDIHAHLPVPREAHFQMRAEDLNALTLLRLADPENALPVNECFTGKLDSHSTPACEIYVSQEIQDFQMGHLTLLNLTNLVGGYHDMGGTLEYWRSRPHWDLIRAMRDARQLNSVIVWSHFCSLPGAQSAVGVALGLVDALELITWNDPTQFPNHWGPWLNSGKSQADFPVMRPVDLYYQYLNAGFRLPIAAGTDKFGEEIPLGSNRTYAHVREPANYASWVAAVKDGRAFVSNGPILEFDADGREAGDVVHFEGSRRVNTRVVARSIVPFTTLEIVMNGEIVGHKTVALDKNHPRDGVYSMEVNANIELTRSAWVAARVVDHPDLKNRILPRDVSTFAHTGPVYFLQNGRKVREEASIVYLRKYVEGLLHWLQTKPKFFNEQDRLNATRTAQEALQVYGRL